MMNTLRGGAFSPPQKKIKLCSLVLVLAETAWLGEAVDEGQKAFP